jgi:putative flippase GtrA
MRHTAPRYLLVGITCALLYNGTMIVGDFFGLHYVASTLIAYVIVVLWGYGLHSAFTFGCQPSARALIRYALGMAANLPASVALMFVFADIAGIAVAVAAPLTTAILFLWNFVTSRWAIVGSFASRKAA